jgi:hypothetical protein
VIVELRGIIPVEIEDSLVLAPFAATPSISGCNRQLYLSGFHPLSAIAFYLDSQEQMNQARLDAQGNHINLFKHKF